MDQIEHKFVHTNGVNIHVAEIGSGPVVLLLHGFPEIWYSWRHQMLALAAAGFHAIAPDHRGYGLSENPNLTKIDWTDVVNDVVALLNAIGVDKVFVVAKDWGAFVAYVLAYQHPQRIRAFVSLGVPYSKPLSPKRPLRPPGHYIRRFAEPGVAEADFGRFDVATVVKRLYILFSNSDMPIASENEHTLDLVKPSDPLPEWMTEEDLRTYSELYEKSGLKGPLEVPYRCWSRTAEKGNVLEDLTVTAPMLLVMGNRDYARKMLKMYELMGEEPDLFPQFKSIVLEEGTHFMQEQLPNHVNQIILEFLNPLVLNHSKDLNKEKLDFPREDALRCISSQKHFFAKM